MAAINPPNSTDWLDAADRVKLPDAPDRIVLPSSGKSQPEAVAQAAPPEPSNRAGFSLCALWPSTIVLTGVSVAAVVYLRPLVRSSFVLEAIWAPLAAIWAGQIVRGLYRRYAYDYRLSETTVARRRGPLYPRDEPLQLAIVGAVDVRRTLLERILGVGSVVVQPEESSGRPALELTGVRQPGAFAKRIEDAVSIARAAVVKSAKLPAFPGSR